MIGIKETRKERKTTAKHKWRKLKKKSWKRRHNKKNRWFSFDFNIPWDGIEGRGRGQLTIVGVIMTFIALVAFIALAPVLIDLISNSGITGTEKTLLDFFPTLILLGIIIGAYVYFAPTRTQ